MEVKHNFDDLRDAALPQFPKAVYHDTLEAVVVSSAEELKGLGAGWRDHPDMAYAKFVTGVEPKEKPKATVKPKE